MSESARIIKQIKCLMAKKNIGQTELVRLSGIGYPQMNRYLNGHNEPSVEKLAVIAKALGVSLASLFDDATPESAPARKPSPEEMLLFMADHMGISEKRRDLIEFALLAKDSQVKTIHADLEAFSLSAGKHDEAASGA